MDDPFAPSTDPDIPTPTRDDLLRLVRRGIERDLLAAGKLEVGQSETLLRGARRQWDEGHKRKAQRRRAEEARQSQEIGTPLAGGKTEDPPDSDSQFSGTFSDIEPPTGIRVPEQYRDRSRTPQEEYKDKLLAFMPKQLRADYDAADLDQRQIIWAANERAYKEAAIRKEQRDLQEQDRIANALDMWQRVKEDPNKADRLPPENASMADILKWYEDMSKVKPTVPHPGSIDAGAGTQSYHRPDYGNLSESQLRQDRIRRAIQSGEKPDPDDIAAEEAEAERYRLKLERAREKKLKEVEAEFAQPEKGTPGARQDPKPLHPHGDPRNVGSSREIPPRPAQTRAMPTPTSDSSPTRVQPESRAIPLHSRIWQPIASAFPKLAGLATQNPKTSFGGGAGVMIIFAVGIELSTAWSLKIAIASAVAYLFALYLLLVGYVETGQFRKRPRRSVLSYASIVILLAMCWFLLLPERPLTPEDYASAVWKQAPSSQGVTEHPDISLKLVYPKGLAIIFINESSVIIREPKYIPAMWNLDRENWNEPLPVPVTSGDWVRAREQMGPQAFLSQPNVSPLLKQGDRIFGIVQVTCPNCVRTKAYWVYVVHGVGGWYSEMAPGYYPDLTEVSRLVPQIRQNPEQFFADIPAEKRIQIGETY